MYKAIIIFFFRAFHLSSYGAKKTKLKSMLTLRKSIIVSVVEEKKKRFCQLRISILLEFFGFIIAMVKDSFQDDETIEYSFVYFITSFSLECKYLNLLAQH